jgi:hypothetical protein
MGGLNAARGGHVRSAMAAGLLCLAGCASQPAQSDAPPGAGGPVPVQLPAASPAPPAPINVVDGNAWTPALAAVTRSLQQAALDDGEVEVVRTGDNRLRLRIDAAIAVDRRGEALQPRFQRFTEGMAQILAPYPSVQVQVVAYSGVPQPTAARKALAWARYSLRVLAQHGVGAERLTARTRSTAEAEAGGLAASGRCIEFLLSDPLVR